MVGNPNQMFYDFTHAIIILLSVCSEFNDLLSLLLQTTEDTKQEKKNDQPPQAKKPKVKTKTVELPIENNLHWQLSTEVLNLLVENEVRL